MGRFIVSSLFNLQDGSNLYGLLSVYQPHDHQSCRCSQGISQHSYCCVRVQTIIQVDVVRELATIQAGVVRETPFV